MKSTIFLALFAPAVFACSGSTDPSSSNEDMLDTSGGGAGAPGSGGTAGSAGTAGTAGTADTAGTGGSPDAPSGNDADPCNLNSGWPGDELCILPPAAGEGIQLHVGPTDYDNPDAVAPFLINPGEEDVRCFMDRVPEGDFYYFAQKNRMRSGSHHMLIGLENDTGQAEGPGGACDLVSAVATIPGSQTPSRDFPGEVAPEDEGLARWLPANTMAGFQLHYVNTGDEPLLREAWINVYRKDESEVTDRLQSVFMVGDFSVNVPPQTQQTTSLSFTPTLSEPVRIYQLNGHSHAHTESFTVYRVRNGQRELVYQSFDWAEPDVLTYNTITQNPAPDPVAQMDGGVSGLLFMEPGDSFAWECDVNNTTDAALRFANEAYTAEMCLLSGGYVSDTGGLIAGACFGGSCFAGFGL